MNKRDAKFLAGKGWEADGLQARNAWAPTKQGPKGAWHEAEKKKRRVTPTSDRERIWLRHFR